MVMDEYDLNISYQACIISTVYVLLSTLILIPYALMKHPYFPLFDSSQTAQEGFRSHIEGCQQLQQVEKESCIPGKQFGSTGLLKNKSGSILY